MCSSNCINKQWQNILIKDFNPNDFDKRLFRGVAMISDTVTLQLRNVGSPYKSYPIFSTT